MKTRRHHNNSGVRQIKRGQTREQVERIAKKLNIKTVKSEKSFERNNKSNEC